MQTNNEQRTKIIMERANLMLEVEEWLINAAIATLIIPVNERK